MSFYDKDFFKKQTKPCCSLKGQLCSDCPFKKPTKNGFYKMEKPKLIGEHYDLSWLKQRGEQIRKTINER